MNDTIIKREMAARLQRIEAAMTNLPPNIQNIKDRYTAARNNLYTVRGIVNTLKSLTEHDRNVLTLTLETMQTNMYLLVDAICSLAQLELAASDYAVLMCLLRDDLEDISSEGQKANVGIFDVPDVERKEAVA